MGVLLGGLNALIALGLSMVFGGMRTKDGATLGSLVYVLLYFALARYGGYSLLIQGVILIAIMLISPQGLLGILNWFSPYRAFMAFMDRPILGG
jgi:branched-chain amino acid transport system permease protein